MAVLIVTPTGIGLPGGMAKDTSGYPADFGQFGCTSCHGTKGLFNPGTSLVSWSFDNQTELPGNAYEAGKAYLIRITLANEQNPDADNHAGFNLGVNAGALAPPEGSSLVSVSSDGLQATHTNAGGTSWDVQWTAPASGAVIFDLFVNDVNGESGADGGDQVHRAGWWLTDHEGAQAGAAAEVHEPHFGITLQQYWIGLIGVAGMLFIMVAGYVYLKYVGPHNTDQKDR